MSAVKALQDHLNNVQHSISVRDQKIRELMASLKKLNEDQTAAYAERDNVIDALAVLNGIAITARVPAKATSK